MRKAKDVFPMIGSLMIQFWKIQISLRLRLSTRVIGTKKHIGYYIKTSHFFKHKTNSNFDCSGFQKMVASGILAIVPLK